MSLLRGALLVTSITAGSLLFGGMDASAQRYRSGGGSYQPRGYTYTPPRPYFSQNTYGVVGGAVGGAAGTFVAPFAGPAAPYVPYATGAAGAIYGNSLYNNQNRTYQYYYAPQAYGMRTTTPYMIRSYPRY